MLGRRALKGAEKESEPERVKEEGEKAHPRVHNRGGPSMSSWACPTRASETLCRAQDGKGVHLEEQEPAMRRAGDSISQERPVGAGAMEEFEHGPVTIW